MSPKDDLPSAAPATSRAALRVVVLYGVSAGLFAVLANVVVSATVTDRTTLVYLDMAKDAILMVISAVLLYVVVVRGVAERNQVVEEELARRKDVERTLRETREQLEATLQGVADGITVLDATGRLVYANNAAARAVGYPSAERMVQDAQGNGWLNAFDFLDESGDPIPPDQLPGRLALRGVQCPPITVRYRLKSTEEERWSVLQATPTFDEQGKVRFSVIVAHDITERRRAATALMESEERSRSIIAAMEEGIVLQDPGGAIRTCNASAERILGLTADQMMGRTSSDPRWQAIHEDGSPFPGDTHPAMVTLRTGKALSNVVMGVRRPDATLTWISINSQPLWHEGETAPFAVVTSFNDITERVQAYQILEQRVQERTREIERRRRVVEGLRDIVAILNSNRSLEEVLEFVVGQAGRLLQAQAVAVYLVQPDNRLHLQTAARKDSPLPADVCFAVSEGPLGQAVSQRQPVVVADVEAMLADARATSADVRLVQCWEQLAAHYRALLALPLAVEEQMLGGMLLYYAHESQLGSEETQLAIILGDQAALAIQNARLRQQAEQLAVVDERHRLARELHDSVTQSLFSLTLLAEAGRRLAGAGDLARVQAHLARLGATAQQSLKEMRLLVYQLRPVELEKEGLIGALQQRLDAVERRAGVEARLLVEGAVQMPSRVEEELYRIAKEALNNALKHAAATSVVVRIRVADGQLELEVTDNGKGFDPDSAGGTGGLGLVGIRERVERLGGTLTVESSPGLGTQVRVRVGVGSEVPV
jgi:PAS domain S-box-containing protein